MFIKICGITSVSDAHMVVAAGANAIGLNFYPASPRHVELNTASEILLGLPSFVDAVGLFVSETPARIREMAMPLGLRTIQLHGDLKPELLAELREFSVIPAFPLMDESSVSVVLSFIEACARLDRLPSAVLLDAHVPDKFGGTGTVAPWPLARSVVTGCRVPVILAGGLTPKNVAAAVKEVRPWGIDVASGVEVAPGRKESYKVKTFIEEARKAAAARR